jgi:hypothetical protein
VSDREEVCPLISLINQGFSFLINYNECANDTAAMPKEGRLFENALSSVRFAVKLRIPTIFNRMQSRQKNKRARHPNYRTVRAFLIFRPFRQDYCPAIHEQSVALVGFCVTSCYKNHDTWALYAVCGVKNRLIGDFLGI